MSDHFGTTIFAKVCIIIDVSQGPGYNSDKGRKLGQHPHLNLLRINRKDRLRVCKGNSAHFPPRKKIKPCRDYFSLSFLSFFGQIIKCFSFLLLTSSKSLI